MLSPRIMKRESVVSLVFERKKVKEEIKQNGVYKSEGVELKLYENEDDNDPQKIKFIGRISTGKTFFSGTLNWKFQRDGYCYNRYPNGDTFVGCFADDERTKHGFYLWNPKRMASNILCDFYHGFWEANLKHSHGIYLWIDEPENNSEFDNANFEAFVGTVTHDELKKGTYLIKSDDCYFVYYGSFNQSGKKNDETGYFYSSSQDRLFRGKIENDTFVKGFVAYFDPEEGTMTDIVYTQFDSQEQIKSVTLEKDFDCPEINVIKGQMNNFRNIILLKDYFGIIYQDYKDCCNFMDKNFSDYTVFEDQQKYPQLMRLCSQYNVDNITKDIETVISD